MPSPFIVSDGDLAFHNNPLDNKEHRHIFMVNGDKTLVTFRMPGSDRHHAFQYFLIWEHLCDFRTTTGLPIPQDKLLELWWIIVCGKQRYVTAQLWAPVQELHPIQSFPDHIAMFLSLVHYFGF